MSAKRERYAARDDADPPHLHQFLRIRKSFYIKGLRVFFFGCRSSALLVCTAIILRFTAIILLTLSI